EPQASSCGSSSRDTGESRAICGAVPEPLANQPSEPVEALPIPPRGAVAPKPINASPLRPLHTKGAEQGESTARCVGDESFLSCVASKADVHPSLTIAVVASTLE